MLGIQLIIIYQNAAFHLVVNYKCITNVLQGNQTSSEGIILYKRITVFFLLIDPD